jgi:hypothetical protein
MHITRILGTNKNGDVLPDIWADVARVDYLKTTKKALRGFGRASITSSTGLTIRTPPMAPTAIYLVPAA